MDLHGIMPLFLGHAFQQLIWFLRLSREYLGFSAKCKIPWGSKEHPESSMKVLGKTKKTGRCGILEGQWEPHRRDLIWGRGSVDD